LKFAHYLVIYTVHIAGVVDPHLIKTECAVTLGGGRSVGGFLLVVGVDFAGAPAAQAVLAINLACALAERAFF
jgi:hypothetical protein